MSSDQPPDPQWKRISRFRPDEMDIDALLVLLKNPEWQVRFNAVRELRFQPDARALDALLAMFQHEKHTSVRHMVALALGAFHEAGIEVPLFNNLANANPVEIAIKRLKELKVKVTRQADYILLMIPHDLKAASLIEVGVLLAQLTDNTFPEQYSPLDDHVPSAVLPDLSKPVIEYADSYVEGMKFRVYKKPRL